MKVATVITATLLLGLPLSAQAAGPDNGKGQQIRKQDGTGAGNPQQSQLRKQDGSCGNPSATGTRGAGQGSRQGTGRGRR